MGVALHKKWHLLPAGKPGQRFRERYHQHQKSRQSRGIGPMLVRIVLAVLSTAVGFVLMFIPGPAVLFFFIAGALLAMDWLPVARLLDWGEVHVRRWWTRLQRIWKKMSLPARVTLVVTGAALGLATSIGFYRLVN